MKKILFALTLFVTGLGFQPARADLTTDATTYETQSDDYSMLQRYRNRHETIFLGQVFLYHGRTQGFVNVRSCARDRTRLDAIRFQVLNAEADINAIHIMFNNGRTETIRVGRSFRPGAASGWLDLRGGDRCVRRIVIDGDTDNTWFWTQALVRVWGRSSWE
jgi:hypothetical protein